MRPALSMLEDPRLDMAAQNAIGFHDDIAYVDYRAWPLTTAEGERLARRLGGKSVLMLRNHGVLVTAGSAAQGFERLYFLERACQAQILALSTGRKPARRSGGGRAGDRRAVRAGDRVGGEERTELHFQALKRLLDRSERIMRVESPAGSL